MEEIIIDEKKYVSSKQAAKVTGYAKDYVGQLCREGRVPSRLVGRSWYVLESAIKDHKFGAEKPVEEAPKEPQKSHSVDSWESPRYTTDTVEAVSLTVEESEDQGETATALHDAWKSWFERVAPAEDTSTQEDEEEPLEEEVAPDEEEVAIPMRVIHHHPITPVRAPVDMPRRTEEPVVTSDVGDTHRIEAEIEGSVQDSVRTVPAAPITSILQNKTQVIAFGAGIVVAVFTLTLATVGSGLLDGVADSLGQVTSVSGVSIYNR